MSSVFGCGGDRGIFEGGSSNAGDGCVIQQPAAKDFPT